MQGWTATARSYKKKKPKKIMAYSVTAAYDQGGTENPVGIFYG